MGIIAGINAAMYVKNEEPLILDGGDKIRIGQVEFLIVIVGE